MDKKYYDALVQVRLDNAKGLLVDADNLLADESYKSANNRAFYCIEKCIKALLATRHTDVATHNGALKQFNYYFIHEGDGTFTTDDYALISHANQIRNNSDYDDFYVASKKEAAQQVKDARYFFDKCTVYINGLYEQGEGVMNEKKVPEIRFKGFTDDWEQRKLSDVAAFSKGSGYSKSDLKENGTPIILYGRLYTNYETVISDVDTFADAKDSSVYSQGGEVIVPGSGETAEDISIASVVEKSGVLLGGDLNVIHPKEIIDSTFLAISVSNGEPHKDMARRAQGKSIVHLHNEDLAQIELSYPSVSEQEKISRYFCDIDNLITLHQRKSGYLKMFRENILGNSVSLVNYAKESQERIKMVNPICLSRLRHNTV